MCNSNWGKCFGVFIQPICSHKFGMFCDESKGFWREKKKHGEGGGGCGGREES